MATLVAMGVAGARREMATAQGMVIARDAGGVDLEMLWAIDPVALRGVRRKDGLVAVYDVLQLVTLQELKACRMIWARLLEAHPELATICGQLKFNDKGRGSHQLTPATDARGVVHILMVLPGPAATLFRMQAADVIVRYLGGDPELVGEVLTNRRAQEALAREQPQHFARVFGEAVEVVAATSLDVAVEAASPPLALENWREQCLTEVQIELAQAQIAHLQQETKKLHLETVEKAMQFGRAQGYMTNPRYQELARNAVNAGMLPPGETPDGMLDAAEYLRLQGHSVKEVACLAGELGKWWKFFKLQETGEVALTTTQDWAPDEREVHLYHMEKDRLFLAASYAAFKQRPLFARVCPPNTALEQRAMAALEGNRGMPQPKRGRATLPPARV